MSKEQISIYKCDKCGRKCKSQIEEDAKLCNYHLRNKLINDVWKAIK